jgi:O-antigen ligase
VHSGLTRPFRSRSASALLAATAGLNAVFLLASLRLQVAALRSAGPEIWTTAILIGGSLGVGAWNPRAALMAFTLAAPVLSGLSQSALLGCTFSASLVFSGVWVGMAVHRLLPGGVRDDQPPEARAGADLGPAVSRRSCPLLAADILIAAVSLSLAWQLWRHRDSAALAHAIFNQPVFGYGDPWYFLTSAFLWLQGLFFFRSQHGLWARDGARSADPEAEGTAVAAWTTTVFIVYGFTMVVFVLIQLALHIPEGWTSAGLQAPFEDISSFGSMAVAVFIFAVATRRAAPFWRLAAGLVACAGLLAMVVASWSRGAWCSGLVFLLLIAMTRLSRRWAAVFIILPIAAVVLINGTSKAAIWTEQPYLARLAALARVESPANKDPVRLNLYRKAQAMILRHPLSGSGIGSFYLTSVDFARPNDPHAGQPDFAHNALLQVAAEVGLPAAVLLAGVSAWGLWCGLRAWLGRRAREPAHGAEALIPLGATLSLGAYLQTQMTANSLNVYASNQFFFWFLLAAVLAMGLHQRERDT